MRRRGRAGRRGRLAGCMGGCRDATKPAANRGPGFSDEMADGVRARGAAAFGKRRQLAHDAATERQHADHEDQADHDGDRLAQAQEPVHAGQLGQGLAEVADLVLQKHDDEGAQDRAGQRAQPADQRHQDDQARHLPGGVGQRRRHEHQRLGGAGQAGDGGRQHEGQQFETVHVIAQRDRTRLVLAQRLQHLAEGRVHRAPDDVEADDEDAHHHVVQVQVLDRSSMPSRVPRGTLCSPSSPPVNLACRKKKNTICASASVIMAK